MPQMSPLMWGIMFLIFSFLMVLAFVKTYFNYFNEMSAPSVNTYSVELNPRLTWLW